MQTESWFYWQQQYQEGVHLSLSVIRVDLFWTLKENKKALMVSGTPKWEYRALYV